MHLMHRPMEFAQSVGDFVGNIIRRELTDGLSSVNSLVIIFVLPINDKLSIAQNNNNSA
jgi:hypothetical protein